MNHEMTIDKKLTIIVDGEFCSKQCDFFDEHGHTVCVLFDFEELPRVRVAEKYLRLKDCLKMAKEKN
jgi:hypothetical protein